MLDLLYLITDELRFARGEDLLKSSASPHISGESVARCLVAFLQHVLVRTDGTHGSLWWNIEGGETLVHC